MVDSSEIQTQRFLILWILSMWTARRSRGLSLQRLPQEPLSFGYNGLEHWLNPSV